LTSYAGFEYRNITYFLSEKADTDLLRFMTENANAAIASVDEIWLRDQYKGLAGALAAIHGPTNGLTAYHHDIKPSNILLFKPSNALKLSDWGCSAMKPNDSQQASPNTDKRAMLPYLPPESVDKTPTSQPHDVWSLGCVFLEVLVWFLDGEEARQLLRKRIGDEKQNTKGCWFLMEGFQTIRSESV
jgi:serine/threonine protein kinase